MLIVLRSIDSTLWPLWFLWYHFICAIGFCVMLSLQAFISFLYGASHKITISMENSLRDNYIYIIYDIWYIYNIYEIHAVWDIYDTYKMYEIHTSIYIYKHTCIYVCISKLLIWILSDFSWIEFRQFMKSLKLPSNFYVYVHLSN